MAVRKTCGIAVIPADGIGVEVVPDHICLWGALLQFRRKFDQYVNLRPGVDAQKADLCPNIAGQGIANPVRPIWSGRSGRADLVGPIWSGAMMLHHLGAHAAAAAMAQRSRPAR